MGHPQGGHLYALRTFPPRFSGSPFPIFGLLALLSVGRGGWNVNMEIRRYADLTMDPLDWNNFPATEARENPWRLVP